MNARALLRSIVVIAPNVSNPPALNAPNPPSRRAARVARGASVALVAVAVLAVAPPAAAQAPAPPGAARSAADAQALECADPAGGHAAAAVPTADLTCVPLYAAAAAPDARGVLRLLPPATPFGVAVTRDGVLLHRFVVEARGLPAPESLGPYTRYVAWITPPTLSPMVRLGDVANGRSELREGGFNRYLFLVSAEGPDPVEERTGPLVLRGTSPTMVLRPHDLPYLLAEMSARITGGADGSAGHAHAEATRGEATRTEPAPDEPERRGGEGSPERAGGAQLPRATVSGGRFPGARAPDAAAGDAASGAARPGAGDVPGASGAHDAHRVPAHELPPAAERWRVPPMYPGVDMPAQMMTLRPDVSPLLPFPDSLAHGGAEIPDARPRERVSLADGDTLVLEAGPLFRRVGGLRIPGYGFNGQSPGPLIEADEGSTIHIRFRNRTPMPSAIHWHGIRLDAQFDGVPGVTQDPVRAGADFLYALGLRDEGTFWYHPHLREDVMQDMGLAGNLRVHPRGEEDRPRYAPVDAEEFLVLDDHLVGPDGPVPYGREAPIHTLMGRFGNVLLVNGSDDWSFEARPGQVVRFHFTNAASTRTFNVSFGGLPMKLVASDVGKLPRELVVESVVVAPAERWVVDVRFPDAGSVAFENRVQALDHMGARFLPEVTRIGTVRVRGERAAPARVAGGERVEAAFADLRENAALVDEVEQIAEAHLGAPPDRTLVLGLRAADLPFPLDPLVRWEGVYRPPVEWAGTMPDMDWLATGRAAQWRLYDPDSDRENMEIDWRFRLGERVRLRLVNDRSALHAMQHPVHLHGQRFLVLSVDGEPVAHPSWKDTVLVPVGSVVDLLVEMENPGPWMLHCHIAEHLESGMMTVIRVDP